MATKVKIMKKGSQYYIQEKENYTPFSNLSLCPKSIIDLAQSSFNPVKFEKTINNLKTPSQDKHDAHLSRMKQIANKQEMFVHGWISQSQIETIGTQSDHSYYDQLESHHRKDSMTPFYEDSYNSYPLI